MFCYNIISALLKAIIKLIKPNTICKAYMKLNKFYQGDCFDLIKKLANKSVDLVISDGPYGITSHEWDKVNNIQEYNLKLMQEIYPKLKDGGALYLFGKPGLCRFY